MNAKLVAEDGLLKELVLSLEEGDHWVIGRDPDACQLLVEDPAASRQHALCRKTTNGIIIENLSRVSPVVVNDEPVTEPRFLQQGDAVKIGETTFRFYNDDASHLYEDAQNNETEEQAASKAEREEDAEADTVFDEPEAKSDLANISFDLADTGRWLLKVVGGPNNGAEFSMQSGSQYIIGTDPNTADIVFYDTSVSRQHAKITITDQDELFIEDLKSRNATRIDDEQVTERRPLPLNVFINVGTSSFVVYDREGEMQTIISPLLPSIVKALQREEAIKTDTEPTEGAAAVVAEPLAKPAPTSHLGTFILVAILMGLFVVAGIGINTLFTHKEVVVEAPVNTEEDLERVLAEFAGVKYAFNKTTGRLLLVGHVATASDKSELLYNLQGLKFLKEVDDSGVIIDEYVWSEGNQLLSRNPAWRGISVHSPVPGKFVLSGYLQHRKEADQLWDYMTRNFSYPDLLENKVIVEEDIITAATSALREHNFNAVTVQLSNGELSFSGGIRTGAKPDFDALIEEFKTISGVRSVKNYVAEVAKQDAVINVSDKYTISGVSKTSDGGLNVVINGRILSRGDVLDGMTIISIQPNLVLLDRDGVTYRVDVNR